MVPIIARKRDGFELSREEIAAIISGYVRGEVPDYQVAAWLMACFLRGLSEQEMFDLTEVIATSGQQLDLSEVPPPTVDKHSTGGVGDKTSLVVVPLLAAAGARIAKMSGRGLGFTGGTVDKLESIPGYRTALSPEEIVRQVKRIGCCLVGQTEGLAPADKKLYALRDVTATVESIPLIAASIMSKKLAGGAQTILLDVKVGSGAFMTDLEQARTLATALVAIGQRAGRRMVALLTDMNQPLGWAVGNALEVREAIQTLTPGAPSDPRFRELCLQLSAHALTACGLTETVETGLKQAEAVLDSGAALEKFRQMVEAQGGDPRVIDSPNLLPSAPLQVELLAPQSGWVKALDTKSIGWIAGELGAARKKKEDVIDPVVGFEIRKHIGERVEQGEPLLRVHARSEEEAQGALARLQSVYLFSEESVSPPPLLYERRG